MIIGISGKIGSGKDTVGKIIQWSIDQDGLVTHNGKPFGENTLKDCIDFINSGENLEFPEETDWQIKKFADKLKDTVCLWTGCTREQLENANFKNKELGEEWWYYKMPGPTPGSYYMNPYLEWKDIKTEATDFSSYLLVKLTYRMLLQLLGTDCGRNIIHPNIWVNALFAEYKEKWNDPAPIEGNDYTIKTLEIMSDDVYRITYGEGSEAEVYKHEITSPNWIITDMRFPNELEAVKNRGGISIRVIRDKLGFLTENEHESETALDNANFDYIIFNNGSIEELIEKVKEILIKEKII